MSRIDCLHISTWLSARVTIPTHIPEGYPFSAWRGKAIRDVKNRRAILGMSYNAFMIGDCIPILYTDKTYKGRKIRTHPYIWLYA